MRIRWSFLFLGSFVPHFQTKLSIHASNFISRFVSMSELELFLLIGVLTPNFNTMDLVKISEKNKNFTFRSWQLHWRWRHAQPWAKKKSEKKWKTKILWAKKTFFENPTVQPLGSFSHMAACSSSLENTWKMSLILVFNKNSPRVHMESELGVLGVHGKLVKYVVHSSKRKKWKRYIFLHKSCPNSNRPVFGLKEF
jgi:hypothetical protein